MRRFHLLLAALSLIIIFLSLNRLTSLTTTFLDPFEFLRLLDFNAMLPLPLSTVLIYYLLRRDIIAARQLQAPLFLVFSLLFVTGIYLFGAGSGDHEITNYLNTRFCRGGAIDSPLCNIIAYNDDVFSHLVYYAGFVALNLSLLFTEFLLPRKTRATRLDLLLILPNALIIAAGIFANLAFEEVAIDLAIFTFVTLLSLYLLWLKRRDPLRFPTIFYIASSYSIGIITTLFYKLL